jgi:chromosome segregation ATPase
MGLVLLLAIFSEDACAQKKGNAADERKENQRVANAEREVAQLKKELSAIQKSVKEDLGQLAKRESALVQLRKNMRQVREDVEDRLGEKLGIPSALQAQRKASSEFDAASAKVIESLSTSPEWKAAKATADAAKEERKALLEDVELDDDARKVKLKKTQDAIDRLSSFEQDAIRKDPVAGKAQSTLQSAQSQLDQLRKQLPKDKIDADPKVVQLDKELQKLEKEIADSRRDVDKHRSTALSLQRKLVQAQSALQKARAADAADPNRKKSSKK